MNIEKCDLRSGEAGDPLRHVCDRLATMRYPTMYSGWMYLCEEHGEKHKAYCERLIDGLWVNPALKGAAK